MSLGAWSFGVDARDTVHQISLPALPPPFQTPRPSPPKPANVMNEANMYQHYLTMCCTQSTTDATPQMFVCFVLTHCNTSQKFSCWALSWGHDCTCTLSLLFHPLEMCMKIEIMCDLMLTREKPCAACTTRGLPVINPANGTSSTLSASYGDFAMAMSFCLRGRCPKLDKTRQASHQTLMSCLVTQLHCS